MRKQLLAVATAFCLLQGQTGNMVTAEAVEEVQPYSLFTDSVSTSIYIENKTAKMTGAVIGDNVVTKIEVRLVLQKHNGSGWVKVKAVEKTTNDTMILVTGSASAVKSYRYRAKGIYTIYSGSKSESTTCYSGIACY